MNTPGTMRDVITQWWRNWRSSRSTQAALERCGPAEVNRIASDVGLDGRELRALAGKWPDSADQLNHRLRALGLDASAAAPLVMRDLQRTCSTCDSKGTCTRDLYRDESDPHWREYCPNVGTLDALLLESELRRAGKRARHRQWRVSAS